MNICKFAIVSVIIAIVSINSGLIRAQESGNVLFPSSMKWIASWKVLAENNMISPELKKAKIMLPIDNDTSSMGVHYFPIYNNTYRKIGSIVVNHDWTNIVGFSLWPLYDESEDRVIDIPKAAAIASSFCDSYITSPGTRINTVHDKMDENGRYLFHFHFMYKDISIEDVQVYIDYRGYVVEMKDRKAEDYCNREIDKILKDIPESPGKEHIQVIAKNNINNYGECEIIGIERKIEYIGDNQDLYWRVQIKRNHNGEEYNTVKIYELGDKIEIDEWKKATEPHTPIISNEINVSSNPVFSKYDNTIWWSGNTRWCKLPKWYPMPPASLLCSNKAGKINLYRPLPDLYDLSLEYSFPSPSPDGRWLAFQVFNHILAVIDLKFNRLYSDRLPFRSENRISWSDDSTMVAFVIDGKAYIKSLLGESNVPLDTEAVKLVDKKMNYIALEFVPNQKNTLIAVVSDAIDDSDSSGKLMLLHMVNGKIAIDPLIDTKSPILRMHILPKGDKVWVLHPTGCYEYDIKGKTKKRIDWLITEKDIIDGYVFSPEEFDWDISKDGTEIAFTLIDKNTKGCRVCTSTIQGNGIKFISPIISKTVDRYFVGEKYGVVSKEFINEDTLVKLGIIKQIPWINPIPSGGPFERYPVLEFWED